MVGQDRRCGAVAASIAHQPVAPAFATRRRRRRRARGRRARRGRGRRSRNAARPARAARREPRAPVLHQVAHPVRRRDARPSRWRASSVPSAPKASAVMQPTLGRQRASGRRRRSAACRRRAPTASSPRRRDGERGDRARRTSRTGSGAAARATARRRHCRCWRAAGRRRRTRLSGLGSSASTIGVVEHGVRAERAVQRRDGDGLAAEDVEDADRGSRPLPPIGIAGRSSSGRRPRSCSGRCGC